jgi:triacylglycerol esterase/lipase EstA (alpha/beta hydrolase family)
MAGVKTIFIVFIHGFKGDEETFFQFPQDLKTLVQEKVQQEAAQDLKVETAVYPKYDTRGDLGVAVEAFKEWLQGQVTELEVKEGTKGPIQNPSVGVVLVAHSVGGLVAADTLFSVLDNRPVSSDEKVRLVWPLVYGLMAFDTPYNGLSRSMFAYGRPLF